MINWKYILIVVILATIVGGGILWWTEKQEIPTESPQKIERVKETMGGIKEITEEELTNRKEECAESEDSSRCYLSLARELRDPFICEEIKLAMPRTTCYEGVLEFFISLKDSQLCKKFPEYSPGKSHTEKVRRRYECYRKIANLLKDSSVCDELETSFFRNSCYIKVAFDLKDSSVCNNLVEIKLESLKEEWPELYYFPKRVEYLNSKEICAQISQEPEPWRIYQNKEDGWEIGYPNNFIVKEGDNYIRLSFISPANVITLTSPEVGLWTGKYYGDFAAINIEKLDTEQTLEEWVVKKFNLKEFKEGPMESGEITFRDSIKKSVVGKDIPAIKVHWWAQAYDSNKRYIKYKKTIIGIVNTCFSESENTPIFNQMLSTFRFLE